MGKETGKAESPQVMGTLGVSVRLRNTSMGNYYGL